MIREARPAGQMPEGKQQRDRTCYPTVKCRRGVAYNQRGRSRDRWVRDKPESKSRPGRHGRNAEAGPDAMTVVSSAGEPRANPDPGRHSQISEGVGALMIGHLRPLPTSRRWQAWRKPQPSCGRALSSCIMLPQRNGKLTDLCGSVGEEVEVQAGVRRKAIKLDPQTPDCSREHAKHA